MIKRLLVVCFCSLSLTLVQAQVKVGATPTGKHARAINAAKGAKGQAEERKAQAKQIKEQKKAIKKYDTNYGKLKKKRLKDWKRDFVDIQIWTEQDSLAVAEEVLADLPVEYREIVMNPVNLDSVALSYAKDSEYNPETVLEGQAKEFLPGELGEAGGSPLEGLPSDPAAGGLDTPGVPGVEAIKIPSKPNPNLVKPAAARKLFKKIDPEQFQKVQEDISKLKNKYSSLPDTRFPEEGRKRNSLEDLPFKKRLYFGGNINASSTDPLIMDISLQLGYWINKKWLAGTGLIVREQFNQQDSSSLTGDAYGFSFFMRYDILKQFYAWGESQSQVNRSLLNNESNAPTKWEHANLLGIGRDFSIGPVRMTSLIMYDFNYLNNNLNSRPWVFRLGFQLTKKP
ncbi:MAG: hypothetical protein ABJP45_03375 [Cyclobacteriaceae bacterium]